MRLNRVKVCSWIAEGCGLWGRGKVEEDSFGRENSGIWKIWPGKRLKRRPLLRNCPVKALETVTSVVKIFYSFPIDCFFSFFFFLEPFVSSFDLLMQLVNQFHIHVWQKILLQKTKSFLACSEVPNLIFNFLNSFPAQRTFCHLKLFEFWFYCVSGNIAHRWTS